MGTTGRQEVGIDGPENQVGKRKRTVVGSKKRKGCKLLGYEHFRVGERKHHGGLKAMKSRTDDLCKKIKQGSGFAKQLGGRGEKKGKGGDKPPSSALRTVGLEKPLVTE